MSGMDTLLEQARALSPEPVPWAGLRVAVLIPCHNEAVAIPKVVADFRSALPGATVYVYDNNSSDGTAEAARAAGAVVRREALQGKGCVIRRAFADVEADIYVLVDGDDTYDAAAAPIMVRRLIEEQLDMVTGRRVSLPGEECAAYRRGHRLGNRVLTGLVRSVFGDRVSDMLSGYRVFSRRFVKSFPALSSGFEIETEVTVHALELGLPVGEEPTRYKERPAGSRSKLRTFSDGARILRTIAVLVKQERPLQVFAGAGLTLLLAGLVVGIPVVLEFHATGYVSRLPSAVLATGLVLLSFLSFCCGLILDSVARGRKELRRLAYLAVPPAMRVPY
jgi:glycosyltransferase involved in cell wall biosynthesis